MYQDKNGKWEEIKGGKCIVRLLTEPSQSFLNWQASNPIIDPEPSQLDKLEKRVEALEKK